MNNYWVTNFRASQPGPMRFRYELITHSAFDPVASTQIGLAAGQGIEIHPVVGDPRPSQRPFILVRSPGVVLLQFRPADDGRDVMVMLLNATDRPVTARVRLPDAVVRGAWRSNALETRLTKLNCRGRTVSMALRGREVAIARISLLRGHSGWALTGNRVDDAEIAVRITDRCNSHAVTLPQVSRFGD